MIPTKFRFIQPSGFREEEIVYIDQSETSTACGGHFVNGQGQNVQQMFSIKFRFIQPSGFRGEDFFQSANQIFSINQSETRLVCGSHVC